MKNVLDKLKFYINKRRLTIYKLTEMSDLSENTIYNWYNKGAEPSLHALYSICNILDITMAELFSESDEEILSVKENELIKMFRKLSIQQRELLISLMSEFKINY